MLIFEGRQQNTSILIRPLWKLLAKSLAKLLFKLMDAQELQDPEKVSTSWVRNFDKNVNKINYTISSMIGMKPKDTIKLHAVPLDKTYPDQPGEQHEDQKRQQTLSGVKVHID